MPIYINNKNKNCDCEDNFDCGCQVKDLGTKCVIYDGTFLPNLNISPNTSLRDILVKIDTIIGELKNNS